MSDNYAFTELSSATTSGHNRPQALAVQAYESSLGQLSVAIQGSLGATQYTAPASPPLIAEQTYLIPDLSPELSPELIPDLSPEQKLHMYLTVARSSQHITVMENAFALGLRTQRLIVNATLSNTMPTALKIKTCEIPVLKLFLEFGLKIS